MTTISPPSDAPKPSRRRLVFLLLATAAGTFGMLQSLVSPALPTLQTELHTTQSTVTWVITAWLISAAVATPIMGRLGDVHGKEHFLIVAISATAAGSLLGALAPSIGFVIAGRVLQGIGGATVPLAFGIIRDEYPRERVMAAVGSISSILAIGGGIGTVVAGPIVDALGWRWLFWIPFIISALTGLLGFRLIPETPVRNPGQINWVAAVLLSGWLVALLIPLSEAPEWGWNSIGVISLFVAAAVLFAVWIVVEARSKSPLIDMKMLRIPVVATTNGLALMFGAGLFAVTAFLPQFVQTPTSTGYGLGLGLTAAGLLRLPMLVTMAVAGALSSRLVRVGLTAKWQLVLAGAFTAIGLFGFAFFHDYAWQPAVASGLSGLGIGLAWASMSNLIVHSVPSHQTSVATGMNTNIRNIGGAIGTAVASSIITSSLVSGGFPAESGYVHAFSLLGVVSVAAMILAFFIPTSRPTGTQTITAATGPAKANA